MRTDYGGICGHTIAVESGTAELDDIDAANKSVQDQDRHQDVQPRLPMPSRHSRRDTSMRTPADLPVALFYVKAHGGAIRLAGKPFGSGAKYGIGIRQERFGPEVGDHPGPAKDPCQRTVPPNSQEVWTGRHGLVVDLIYRDPVQAFRRLPVSTA